MIRRPPRSTPLYSSAASDVYKRQELMHLMRLRRVEKKLWRLFSECIEEFEPKHEYDIVIAEGFILGVVNRNGMLQKIEKCLKPGGVAVVTCVDDISFFCECLKKIIATRLTWHMTEFADKVRILVEAYGGHLASLKYASRSTEDWVIDGFLNPAIFGPLFAIDDCITETSSAFEYLGSSPNMFTDYSWYKDVEHNRNEVIIEQFKRKRHTLILSDLPESLRTVEENEILVRATHDLRKLLELAQNSFDDYIPEFINKLEYIRNLTRGIDLRLAEAIAETCELLANSNVNAENVKDAKKLAGVFGRGQQYVSLVKKITY